MAQVDFFLKLDGIPGESADDKHKGEIHILSWTCKAQNSGGFGTATGGGSGKVRFDDWFFTKPLDKASPKLFQHCASGEHVKSGILTCRKAGKDAVEYLKVTFDNVLVSSYEAHAGEHEAEGGGVVPTDRFSLNFGHVKVEYKEQKPDGTAGGSTVGEWNVAKNSASAA
ncbi:MAG: type VI secretion system tube protein Hcp [Terriglobales bacterium]|jgi:type VI secretion system secreted protein Hcp